MAWLCSLAILTFYQTKLGADLGHRFFSRSDGADDDDDDEFLGISEKEGSHYTRYNVIHKLCKSLERTENAPEESEMTITANSGLSKMHVEELAKLIECQDPRILGAYEDYFQHVTAIVPEPSIDDFSGESVRHHKEAHREDTLRHEAKFARRLREILDLGTSEE